MPLTAVQLSDYSHDVVYDTYKHSDRIPLAAYLVAKSVTPTEKDIEWAKNALCG